ncbi:hypothetical protein ABBQ38_014422 [Trebouxia sp. C0009 RCD-2024]
MRQARLALEAYRPSRAVDKVLGARQRIFAACVPQRKDAFRLHPDAGLSEKSLTESETRNKRYCKAMTLKLPRSDIESDLEETQSLLLFNQQDLEEDRSSRSLRVWFAAESEKQHLSWQKHLIRGTVAAGRPASEDGDRSSDSGRSVSSCSLGPSPVVAYRLCGPGKESGEALLKRFKDIRRTLEQGLHNLGSLREEGKAAQHQLWNLHTLLMEMCRQIREHSVLEDKLSPDEWEEDKKVLDACEKWLQQAEALVIEADAKIEGIMHQDSGNLLAEEWVTFVHKYSMQIKDIEQALRVGQLMEKRHRDHSPSSSDGGPLIKIRCRAAPRSCMPYSTYWARKIAI